MGQFVIAAYRPKKGKARGLMKEVRQHVPILRQEGLVTDRPPHIMRAKDGTIVEVFEWKSAKAIDRAHHNPAVLAMWARYDKVCSYVSLTSLAEAGMMFATFEPVEV